MSVDGSTLHNGLIFAIAGLETVTPTTPRTYRLLPALAITVLVGSGASCPWTFGIMTPGWASSPAPAPTPWSSAATM